MSPSSAFCQAQEAAQMERATRETLENVRNIALSAAAAWRAEGLLAEKREKGHGASTQPRLTSVEQTEDDQEVAEEYAREHPQPSASENPDRGLATA